MIYYEALIDRRQGRFEEAIKKLNTAITQDPQNPAYLYQLAVTLYATRQVQTAEHAFDRLSCNPISQCSGPKKRSIPVS